MKLKHLLSFLLLSSVSAFAQQKMPKMESMKGQEVICPASKVPVQTVVEMPAEIKAALDARKNRTSAAPKKSNIEVTYIGFPSSAQASFERAVEVWEEILESEVQINVIAIYESLGDRVLGSASPATYYRNFAGAKELNTWYPIALAEKMAGVDLNDPSSPDIVCRFSSDADWYFDLEGTPPPTKFHFSTIILHELGHGLGFVSFMNYNDDDTGEYDTFPNIYDTKILDEDLKQLIDTTAYTNNSLELGEALVSENLFFESPKVKTINNGANPKLYAPAIYDRGSSISHLDDETYGAGNENSLMTSAVSPGEKNSYPGTFVINMFGEMGWQGTSIAHDFLKNRSTFEQVEVTARVISDVGLSSAKLFYGTSTNSADFTSQDMQISGSQISGFLPAVSEITEYTYYIETVDASNNTIRTPAGNYVYSVSLGGKDTFGPTIEYFEPSIVQANTPITILANIEDDFVEGIENATLEYSVNGGSTQSITLKKYVRGIDPEELSQGVNDEYAFYNLEDFGNFEIGDKIKYQILGKDKAGNTSILPTSYTSTSSEDAPTPDFFEIAATSLLNTEIEYSNDFDSDNGDFAMTGFSISTPENFNTGNLHTSNPYGNALGQLNQETGDIARDFDKSEIALLRHPIQIKADLDSATISFKEVVLVETGSDGSTYGSDSFYDYVVVEASLISENGQSDWFPLESGYDSGTNSSFESVYSSGFTSGDYQNSTGIGRASMQKQRVIKIYGDDFTQDFAGSNLLIRFRLYSDQFSTAWGWTIDDLAIQKESDPVLATEEIMDNFMSISPNPSTDYVRVQLNLTKEQDVNITLYSLKGEKLIDEVYHHTSGNFSKSFTTLNLTAGTYMLSAKTAEGFKTKRLLVKK